MDNFEYKPEEHRWTEEWLRSVIRDELNEELRRGREAAEMAQPNEGTF